MTEFFNLSRVLRSKKEARSVYDRLGRVYSTIAATERPIRTKAIAMLAVVPGERVLEIGFGPGDALKALARDGVRVTGIDLSFVMAQVAAAKLRRVTHEGQIGLNLGDATWLPYPTCCFDAIFMSFTLELFDTPEIPLVLAECRRVLRSRGRLCTAAMSLPLHPGLMVRVYDWLHRAFPVWADCRPIPLQAFMEHAGFGLEEVWSGSLWGLPVAACVGRKPG